MRKDKFEKLAVQNEKILAIDDTQYVQVEFCFENRYRSKTTQREKIK